MSLDALISPIVDVKRVRSGLWEYIRFAKSWREYASTANAEPLSLRHAHPCLFDRTATHPFDPHYFYQDVWAFKAILASHAQQHVDVGSRAILVGLLTAITHTVFVDIRPLDVSLEQFRSQPGSILALPFANNSVTSLSCLHVAEHIGLGRYGDALDPLGTQKAIAELSRVLAPGGNLYFSIPVGKPRVCFNAHRIHSPEQILEFFSDLELMSFSGIDDGGRYLEDISVHELADSDYACGLFWYTKRAI